MAYTDTSDNVSSSLSHSGSVALSQAVISQILSAVGTSQILIDQFTVTSSNTTMTIPAGTQIGYIHTEDSTIDSITVDNPPPVIVLQSAAGVQILVNEGTDANGNQTYVVVGSAGNDTITIVGNHNTAISLGTGDSTVLSGQGNDTIYANGGSDTISGGGGFDIIVAHGSHTDYSIHTFTPTVVAGTSGLSPQAASTDHVVLTNNTTGETIDFTGVQYVALDNNDAIIVADSTVEAGVASLYHAAFGRTGEAGGVDFWFNYAHDGLSLHQIAEGFTQSAEFAPIAAMSNTDFITQLYANTFGRAPDSGGMSYWLDQMAHGATKADLLSQFATVAALNEQGVLHTEITIVGTVVIDPNIV